MEWTQGNKLSDLSPLGEGEFVACLGLNKSTGESVSNRDTESGRLNLGIFQAEPG